MSKIVFMTLAVMLVTNAVRAQTLKPDILNATGGSGSIGGNLYDYSIGEMVAVSTYAGTTVIVTQGLLQPEKGTTDVSVGADMQQLQVFPNPASTIVNLRYTAHAPGELSYELIDMAGRVLQYHSRQVPAGTTTTGINIEPMACGSYLLHIIANTGENKDHGIYKIQKIK